MSDNKIGVGVGVIVLKEGKLLLGKRHTDEKKASSKLNGSGTWTMPGGKVDFGEGLVQAACRETLEETGIELNSSQMKLVSLGEDQTEGVHFITMGFLHEGGVTTEPKVMEPDAITEWAWFSLSDLPSPLYLPSEKILKNYLDKAIFKN